MWWTPISDSRCTRAIQLRAAIQFLLKLCSSALSKERNNTTLCTSHMYRVKSEVIHLILSTRQRGWDHCVKGVFHSRRRGPRSYSCDNWLRQVFFILVRHNWWLLYILLAIHFNPQPEVDGCFFCTGMQEGIVTKGGIHAEEFQNLVWSKCKRCTVRRTLWYIFSALNQFCDAIPVHSEWVNDESWNVRSFGKVVLDRKNILKNPGKMCLAHVAGLHPRIVLLFDVLIIIKVLPT